MLDSGDISLAHSLAQGSVGRKEMAPQPIGTAGNAEGFGAPSAGGRRASRDPNEPRQFERDIVAVPDEIEVERRPDRRPARYPRARPGGGDRFDLAAFPAEIGDRLVALPDEARDLVERTDEDDAQKSSAHPQILALRRARDETGQVRIVPVDG